MKNHFAKSFAAILISFFLIVVCAAQQQTTCELESRTAPILLNLRLGMSSEQARSVFGRDLKVKVKKQGERTFFQNYIKKPAPASLKNVRALYLRFFDGGLYQIEIFYETNLNLKSLADITDLLSAQLNLPAADWKIENNQARMICGDASLVADNILNPRVELTKETIRAEVERLREAGKKK
jgi:hypothetical protein